LNGNELQGDDLTDVMSKSAQTDMGHDISRNEANCSVQAPHYAFQSIGEYGSFGHDMLPEKYDESCDDDLVDQDGRSPSESSDVDREIELQPDDWDPELIPVCDASSPTEIAECNQTFVARDSGLSEMQMDADSESEVSSCTTPSTCAGYDSADSADARWQIWSSSSNHDHSVARRVALLGLHNGPPPQCRTGWDNDEPFDDTVEQPPVCEAFVPEKLPAEDVPGTALTVCTLCPCSPVRDIGFPELIWHFASTNEC
jgi:hypothetical protein